MYVVRRAELRDMHSVIAIFAEAIGNALWLSPANRLKCNFADVSVGEIVLVCCASDDEVLGFASIYEADSFVHHLYVAEHFQRRGVGTALLKSLEAWLRLPWRLKCVLGNENALAFYSSLGWVEESRAQGTEGPDAILKWPAA
jgi:GNAT superfamily N-acetyltransferase